MICALLSLPLVTPDCSFVQLSSGSMNASVTLRYTGPLRNVQWRLQLRNLFSLLQCTALLHSKAVDAAWSRGGCPLLLFAYAYLPIDIDDIATLFFMLACTSPVAMFDVVHLLCCSTRFV
jgi:hypothetical protein